MEEWIEALNSASKYSNLLKLEPREKPLDLTDSLKNTEAIVSDDSDNESKAPLPLKESIKAATKLQHSNSPKTLSLSIPTSAAIDSKTLQNTNTTAPISIEPLTLELKKMLLDVLPKAPVVREGYLKKCGQRVKTWKKRWFQLKGGTLAYFKTPQDKRPIDRIILWSCAVQKGTESKIVIEIGKEEISKELTFHLQTKERLYSLVSDSSEVADEWAKVLAVEINLCNLQVNNLRILSQNFSILNVTK